MVTELLISSPLCVTLYMLSFCLSTQSESKVNLPTRSESDVLYPLPSSTFSISSLPHIVSCLLSFCHFTPLCCFMFTELELLLIFPSLDLPLPSIIVFVASILMSMTQIPRWYLWSDLLLIQFHSHCLFTQHIFANLPCARQYWRLEMQHWH